MSNPTKERPVVRPARLRERAGQHRLALAAAQLEGGRAGEDAAGQLGDDPPRLVVIEVAKPRHGGSRARG